MTTDLPEGATPVLIRCLTLPRGRYLRELVINQILTETGDLKHSYKNSAHRVAYAAYGDSHHLHFKQKPIHPLMEYAVHALTARIGGHLSPPTELARFEVKVKGKKLIYPVLISKTVQGKTLEEANEVESAQLTWACLCALLTLPGDGRFPNYVVEEGTQRIFCVDNDISFVEPVTQNFFYRYTTHFSSALFCLNSKPLNPEVLEAFLSDAYSDPSQLDGRACSKRSTLPQALSF